MGAWRDLRYACHAHGLATHGFGVGALQSNVPPHLVQRKLGHASLRTTAICGDAVGPEERGFAERMWERPINARHRALSCRGSAVDGLLRCGRIGAACPFLARLTLARSGFGGEVDRAKLGRVRGPRRESEHRSSLSEAQTRERLPTTAVIGDVAGITDAVLGSPAYCTLWFVRESIQNRPV
jgi:hypothetical protein